MGYLEFPKKAASPTKPGIFVATPCFAGLMSKAYVSSLLGLQELCIRAGLDLYVDMMGNESLVERARNLQTARFLTKHPECTHLLFIDADIGFDPKVVLRHLQFDKDVTSAVYSKKGIDFDKIRTKVRTQDTEKIYQMGLDFNINLKYNEPPTEGFVRVLDTATGFLLIKREVIERMYEKYKDELFAVNDVQGHNITNYVALFACMIDPQTKRFLSEDFSFCRRYQAMGGDIWADLAVPLSHTGTFVFQGDIRQRLAAKRPFKMLSSPLHPISEESR